MTYRHEGHNPTITSTDNSGKLEDWLTDQMAKSEFFHQKLHEYGLLEVAYAIETIKGETLEWDLELLGISSKAWNKVIHRGFKPIRVFAHPYTLVTIPRSAGYYRDLAMVSRESMNNAQLSTERFEAGRNSPPLDEQKAWDIARHLNGLISRLIETDEQIDPREFDLWRGMTAGLRAQKAWQNKK